MSEQMKWFFAIVLFIWTLTSMALPVVVFFLTKNPVGFSLVSTLGPPVFLWVRFARYLFPMDEKTFELQKLKILARVSSRTNRPDAQKHAAKKPVSTVSK